MPVAPPTDFPITTVPPANVGETFDRHTWYKYSTKAASKKTRLTFTDVQGMSLRRERPKNFKHNPMPVWVSNTLHLRAVILAYLEGRFYLRSGALLTDGQRLDRISKAALDAIPSLQCQLQEFQIKFHQAATSGASQRVQDRLARRVQELDSTILFCRKGPAVVVASMVNCYWNLGYTSPDVAEQLHCTPVLVRRTMMRMDEHWRKMSGEPRTGRWAPGGKSMRSREALQADRKKLVLEMHAAGESFETVTAKIGISAAYMKCLYRKYGLGARRSDRWSPNNIKFLRSQLSNGLTVRDAARWYGVSSIRMYEVMERHGIQTVKQVAVRLAPPRRKSDRWTGDKLAILRKLRAGGATFRQCAEFLGCPVRNAQSALEYHDRVELSHVANGSV